MFVLRKEAIYIYISDNMNKRILRFSEGESIPTIVAEFREGETQLGALFVTEDERIFVADRRNHKILITDAAERSCSELDLFQLGEPLDFVVEGERLYVWIEGRDTGGMYQCAVPRKLELHGFWMWIFRFAWCVHAHASAEELHYSRIDRRRCLTFWCRGEKAAFFTFPFGMACSFFFGQSELCRDVMLT